MHNDGLHMMARLLRNHPYCFLLSDIGLFEPVLQRCRRCDMFNEVQSYAQSLRVFFIWQKWQKWHEGPQMSSEHIG